MKRSRKMLASVFEDKKEDDNIKSDGTGTNQKILPPGKKIKVLNNIKIPSHSVTATSPGPHFQQSITNKNINQKNTYESPSTSNTYTVLHNVSFSGCSSEAGSLSDLSYNNLLNVDCKLTPESIKELLSTPKSNKQKKIDTDHIHHTYMNSNPKQKTLEINNNKTCTITSKYLIKKCSNAVNTSQAIDLSLPDTSSNYCATDAIARHPETNQIVNENPHNYSDISTDSDRNYEPSSSESSSSDTETVSMIGDENTVSIKSPLTTPQDSEWVDITSSMPNIGHFKNETVINIPPNVTSPFQIYKLFVTDDIIHKMVAETNYYANNVCNDENVKNKSRLKKWVDTSFEEMCTFMGILMTMGVVKLPSLCNYWSKKTCYKNEYIQSLMTRDRFILLLKCWHFSNDAIDPTDKLCKVRDVLNMILSKFNEVLTPGQYLVIDESMIPWRGRLKFRQYIKNKSHKYGIKLYKLCTPEGYTWSMIVYTGKNDRPGNQPHGHDIVLRLIKDLGGSGRTIIADNFYTSLGLAEDLLKKKTELCGTIRINRRGLPKNVISTKLKRGQCIGKMNKNGVKIIKWHDKRTVTMITTCKNHVAAVKEIGQKKRNGERIYKPECISLYNLHKKGVDYSDQMTAYYSSLRRGIKWYRKLMMSFLFGTCVVNAWIIHNNISKKKETLIDFVESIIQNITGCTFHDDIKSSEKKKYHSLEKIAKRKQCTLCYQELRKTMTSREADKKVPKVKLMCVECKKVFCLACFNKAHENIVN
ncbi:piggyBac transposable element-derived protein 4-like [Melitaea cinxia]|uniref:piggyBac transposable element-derived protein 4-like n=1 Tax=Melitaea cinxia TaxID=113334 RepID=UPI001E2740EC|nr:piggyBac transposable element-derived protein 4-like [Melitaea cinxia]XP_045457906.1 piggyBac transposable element-derived protein 4-like [Melitaea cinxia]